MLQTVIAVFITAGKRLLAMLVTKRMIFWALEIAAKQTSTKVDDYLVMLVRAAYDNDEEQVKAAIEALANKYRNQKA